MKKEVRLSQLRKSLLLALPFQLSWLCAALLVFLAGGSMKLPLILALIPLLWAPTLLELITKAKLPLVIQLNFHIFVTASAVGGSGFGLYGLIPHWDTIVHFYSGVIFAWLGLFAVQAAELKRRGKLPKWFVIISALAVPLALATLWECYEFACDMLFGLTMQAGGLDDTMVDSIAAGAGSVVAVLVAVWLKMPKSVMPRTLR